MTWDQLVKSLAKDYKSFLKDYKQSQDILNADIALLLGQHTEKTAPQNITDKLARDQNSWEVLWGVTGQKIVALRALHQKELDAFFSHPENNPV